MAIEGVDYSVSRPSPSGLYAAGRRFACRYLYGTLAGKAVTRAEIDALHAAGLSIVLNWEWQADEAKGGFATGQDRARRTADIVRRLGAPSSAVVYFSVDYDARDMGPVREYFRGITSVWPKSRTGVYGGRRVIEAAKAGAWCPWLWQTFAWSDGVWVPGVHLQQYRNGVILAGGEVDLDRAMVARYGQWTGAFMALTDAQQQEIYNVCHALNSTPPWAPAGFTRLRQLETLYYVLVLGNSGTETTWLAAQFRAVLGGIRAVPGIDQARIDEIEAQLVAAVQQADGQVVADALQAGDDTAEQADTG